MNFYDELGLPLSASAGEIRQAYKNLARLLHPDHQSDARLRKMAELQMTRLNEILGVLNDPAQRRRYDAALQATAESRANALKNPQPRAGVQIGGVHIGSLHPRAGAIVWTAVLMLAAFGFAWVFIYFEHDSGVPAYRAAAGGAQQASTPSTNPAGRAEATPLSSAAAPPPHLSSGGDSDRRVDSNNLVARSPQNPPPQAPAPTEPDAALKSSPSPETSDLFVAPQTPAHSASPVLAATGAKPVTRSGLPLIGTWLYVKPAMEDDAGKNFTYRPEYIEMVVTPGKDGKVFGKYRGRFRVPDRPISSEVVFQFEGASEEGTNSLPWHASDGAAGQIRMKMISEGVMEVSWYTTQFGTAQTLASGIAVLYRD